MVYSLSRYSGREYGEGLRRMSRDVVLETAPHPNPLPEYRETEKKCAPAPAPRPGFAAALASRADCIVLTLAVLGFLFRVAAMVILRRWEQPNDIEHRTLALSLLEHGTFYFRDFDYFGPSSVQSPPYPFLLAALSKLFGPQSDAAYVAAMVINSLAGALTVWLTARLVRAIGGGVATAIFAAGLVAVWPSQIYTATHVQAISLITLCVVAILLLFQR